METKMDRKRNKDRRKTEKVEKVGTWKNWRVWGFLKKKKSKFKKEESLKDELMAQSIPMGLTSDRD